MNIIQNSQVCLMPLLRNEEAILNDIQDYN
jgi:hypothetical protein